MAAPTPMHERVMRAALRIFETTDSRVGPMNWLFHVEAGVDPGARFPDPYDAGVVSMELGHEYWRNSAVRAAARQVVEENAGALGPDDFRAAWLPTPFAVATVLHNALRDRDRLAMEVNDLFVHGRVAALDALPDDALFFAATRVVKPERPPMMMVPGSEPTDGQLRARFGDGVRLVEQAPRAAISQRLFNSFVKALTVKYGEDWPKVWRDNMALLDASPRSTRAPAPGKRAVGEKHAAHPLTHDAGGRAKRAAASGEDDGDETMGLRSGFARPKRRSSKRRSPRPKRAGRSAVRRKI